ncbi:hypothetical protein Pst134EA_003511 [Puccinia striiformis f. sp. tritici]|uniref:hypothetical protein n=1 Tax=Puccinia striiformis f. sp. tritici TaxID=168172 RepID=UPI002008E33F|nr:hypothetical protein Pst134EA_003511 [Puccinia striiformis f. sp. tritici]KAH9472912.1 hypothetical protein Pst134EA_003511 [Puccinia striiformis f. sp. tritici]
MSNSSSQTLNSYARLALWKPSSLPSKVSVVVTIGLVVYPKHPIQTHPSHQPLPTWILTIDRHSSRRSTAS